jgi:hypothetical protein
MKTFHQNESVVSFRRLHHMEFAVFSHLGAAAGVEGVSVPPPMERLDVAVRIDLASVDVPSELENESGR